MTVWYDYRAIAGQQAQRITELEAQLANQDVEWDASHKKAVGMVDNLRARVAELEGLVSRLEDAMTPEQLADFNRLNP